MRVELHTVRADGTRHWVELRERPRPLDYAAIQEAVEIVIEARPDGTQVQRILGGTEERQRFALLAQRITAWSFDGIPVPGQNIAAPAEILDSVFADDQDWDLLCEAVQPLLDRVLRRGPKAETATAT